MIKKIINYRQSPYLGILSSIVRIKNCMDTINCVDSIVWIKHDFFKSGGIKLSYINKSIHDLGKKFYVIFLLLFCEYLVFWNGYKFIKRNKLFSV